MRSATLRWPPRFQPPHKSDRSPASPAQTIVFSFTLINNSYGFVAGGNPIDGEGE
jgi:hypothetical protein